MSSPEFDAYATEYDAGMENPVKSLLGESADDFVMIKLRWLLREFPELRQADIAFRVLDYGCGIGTLLRLMAEAGLRARLMGCDVSSQMLNEAVERWPTKLRQPALCKQDGAKTELQSESIDLVVISAVLHHVPLDERSAVYGEIHRVLRPGGRVVVFEHNPLNPVTRYVVAHTPIDRHAILLRANEVTAALRQRFTDIRTRYLMFLPPRLQSLMKIEEALRWLPLGAQYAVTARR
jgi:ubiquinone/menaquinone biosynthesis C-methylase UbiE